MNIDTYIEQCRRLADNGEADSYITVEAMQLILEAIKKDIQA